METALSPVLGERSAERTRWPQSPDRVASQSSTGKVYLDHLVYDGVIAVVDGETKRVSFRATVEQAAALIAAGRIECRGSRRRVKALYWVGHALQAPLESTVAVDLTGGRDMRSKTRYSHNQGTQTNPKNVWTLVLGGRDPGACNIPESLRDIFLAVALSCVSEKAA